MHGAIFTFNPSKHSGLSRLQSFKIIIMDIKLYSVREVDNADAQHEFDEVTPY